MTSREGKDGPNRYVMLTMSKLEAQHLASVLEKGATLGDLKKARWYLEREIQARQGMLG